MSPAPVIAAKYILAVDLGTSAAKWALTAIDGRVAAWEAEPVPLRVTAGGGNSAVWCQIFADVLGVELRQVKDPIQANARGAAWIAAAGLGEISLTDVSRLVQLENVFAPQAANRAVYDERYASFLEIHKRLRRLYRRLNREASPVAGVAG